MGPEGSTALPATRLTLSAAKPPPSARLRQCVRAFAGRRVVVWGDFLLDEYWLTTTRRVSREAPVLILDYDGKELAGGGAANAAMNLAAMGARVRALGWVGRDDGGRELRALLGRYGIDTKGLLEVSGVATVVKSRILAGAVHTARQQVVRVDRGRGLGEVESAWASRLAAAAHDAGRDAHAVLLSDYGYAAVTPARARRLIAEWRRRGVIVSLDARYALARYRGVTLATPNESEAAAAAGVEIRNEGTLCRAATTLMRRLRPALLVVTRGRDGLAAWPGKGGFRLEAWGAKEAVDPTGAGDAVVAAATLALAARATSLECAALANVAGSVAVSRRGTHPVEAGSILQALRRSRR